MYPIPVEGNNVIAALKALKLAMKKSGTLNELRKRESYLSPSKKRRAKKIQALKTRKRDEAKQKWHDKTHS